MDNFFLKNSNVIPQDSGAFDAEMAYHELRKEVEMLKNKEGTERFSTLDKQDEIKEIIQDSIQSIVWDDFFYISAADPAGSAISSGGAYSDSETNSQITLSILKESRFRCVVNLLAYNDNPAYITTNHVRPVNVSYNIGENDGQWTGFRIDSDGLKIVNFNEGASTSSLVKTDLATGTDLLLEINYFPRERADYYVDGEFVGSISSNLPSDPTLEIFSWHFSEVSSGGSTLDIQRVEFLQRNN